MLKIKLVGLAARCGATNFRPNCRAAWSSGRRWPARLALDPELLFLDEPTSGLDPIGAADFDELIATLRKTLGLTVFMVTHDLDSLYSICDTIAALADGKVIAEGPLSTMLASNHPWLRSYFHGRRARAIVRPKVDYKDAAWRVRTENGAGIEPDPFSSAPCAAARKQEDRAKAWRHAPILR